MLRHCLSIVCILSFALLSCEGISNKCSRTDSYTKLSIPDSILIVNSDTLLKIKTNSMIDNNHETIITTIWGECQICMSKFKEWEQFSLNDTFKNIQIIYIVFTPYPEYFLRIFYPEIKYIGIIAIDSNDSFYSLNNLERSEEHLNTFLIDRELNILLRGNPVILPEVEKQYEKHIKHYNH